MGLLFTPKHSKYYLGNLRDFLKKYSCVNRGCRNYSKGVTDIPNVGFYSLPKKWAETGRLINDGLRAELYSRSDLILSSQIRSGLCVSFKKSSDQSSCLNLNLSFDLKLTSDHWCAFSTVSLCELKITAQVQVQAWTLIWTFFSDHRHELIFIWTLWTIYISGLAWSHMTLSRQPKSAWNTYF